MEMTMEIITGIMIPAAERIRNPIRITMIVKRKNAAKKESNNF